MLARDSLAVNILRDGPKVENSRLRAWATDVLSDPLSLVPLPEEVKSDLVNTLPIYERFLIKQEIQVVDESGRPIEGARIYLMRRFSAQHYAGIAQEVTDKEGKASIRAEEDRTADASGAKLMISVEKGGYETYSSDIQPISSVIITMKKLH